MGFLFSFVFVSIVLVVFGFLLVFISYGYLGAGFLKSGAFECGFQPFVNSGVVFSMPFFVISLMFLLFDVEILLISFPPLVTTFMFSLLNYWLVIFLILLATCYEWMSGILEWISSFSC